MTLVSYIYRMLLMGTSSFSEPDWVGPFYPKGTKQSDFIKYYASVYRTVEIDATYYAIPSQAAINNWITKTDESFVISAKFPKSITHCGKTAVPNHEIILTERTYEDTERFLAQMSQLGRRLGPLILQFPYFSRKIFPDKKIFYDRLDSYLSRLPNKFQFGVEIRNKNWLSKEYAEILTRYNVALVLQDHPWMPMGDEIDSYCDADTADFCYIRLLGDRYAIEKITKTWEKEVIDQNPSLMRWAKVIIEREQKKIPTFAYINNHYAGHAPATLEKLRKLYEEAVRERNSK